MEGLLALVKRIWIQAFIIIGICGAGAFALEKLYLLVPVMVGFLVGFACWVVIGYRILKSSGQDIESAKKSMQFGWVIRLLLIMGTFIAAIRISEEIFWAVVMGFFFMSGVMMTNAIVYAYNSNANKK